MPAKKIKISDIKANPNNPRFIRDDKFEQLKASIQEFPKMMALRPIVVDADGVTLGGNMRLRALQELGYKEIPGEWVRRADELTEEEKRRFIITDNVGYGQWDWDTLANEWEAEELAAWGLDVPEWVGLDPDKLAEGFALPDGDRAPFQQMTFTLADEQAEQVKQAMVEVRKTEEFKYCETFGNENGNGNALYLIIMQWAEQKILG